MRRPNLRIREMGLVVTFAAFGLACERELEAPLEPRMTSGGGTVEILWPDEGAVLSGTERFAARVTDRNPNKYRMYWRVDDGQRNEMSDNWSDPPHKDAWVDVSGWDWRGEGPYTVSFVAEDRRGRLLGERSVSIRVAASDSSGGTATDANPFAGETFWVDPYSNAARQAEEWRESRPLDAEQMDKIAGQSQADWFGDWSGDIYAAVEKRTTTIAGAGALPVYVAYNIPLRDCNGYSGGGASSPDAYRSWIRAFADGIGSRKAVVILEPDALAALGCLTETDQQIRLELIADAVHVLKAKGAIAVYVDAGHARWKSASTMASRLTAAGVATADGFALNVSNFIANGETLTYGTEISSLVGGKRFVIDSSRNGLGPSDPYEWCNPDGRALGSNPTAATGAELVDALLWVKRPGESDGTCNGGPSAGSWWADYALGLAQRQPTLVAAF